MLNVPALPSSFSFDKRATALLVIDMQRDFLTRDGWAHAASLNTEKLTPVIPAVSTVIDACRSAGICIIYTREAHRPDLADCPPRKRHRRSPNIGDPGPMGRFMISGEYCNDIIDELAPQTDDVVIDKPGKGSFFATPLEQILRLRSISSLIVTGVTADVCVQATVFEANDRGYNCLVIEDAIESFDDDLTAAVIKMMRRGTLAHAAKAADLVACLETPSR